MVTDVVTLSSELSVIGLANCVMSKVIVLPGHASAIACRKEPGPLSAFVVTTGLGMHVGVAVGVAVAVAVAVGVAVAVAVAVAVGVGLAVAVAVGVGLAVAVAVGVGCGPQFGSELDGGIVVVFPVGPKS